MGFLIWKVHFYASYFWDRWLQLGNSSSSQKLLKCQTLPIWSHGFNKNHAALSPTTAMAFYCLLAEHCVHKPHSRLLTGSWLLGVLTWLLCWGASEGMSCVWSPSGPGPRRALCSRACVQRLTTFPGFLVSLTEGKYANGTPCEPYQKDKDKPAHSEIALYFWITMLSYFIWCYFSDSGLISNHTRISES